VSRKLILKASVSAILVVGLIFVVYHLPLWEELKKSAPSQAVIETRLASVEGLEERLRSLETEMARIRASLSRSKVEVRAEENEGEEEDEGELGPEERWTALESQVSTLEQRLAGLEDDPIRRGHAFLASESADLRREGVDILDRIARFDPEARAAIRKLLRDPSPRVREEAAEVLGDLRDKESFPEMMELLADSEANVRRRAVQALMGIETPEAVPALVDRLTSDQDERVRETAADALGRLKSPQAAQSLLNALKDQSEDVRAQAIASLGEVGAREAAPHLRAMYDQDPGNNRMRLVIALKTLGDEAPFNHEVQRLSRTVEADADAGVRRQAIRDLSALARDSSRQIFTQALQDPNPSVRREAERALRDR
jgi:HEAT repeat protein